MDKNQMKLVLIQNKWEEKCMKILQTKKRKRKDKEILKNIRLKKNLKCLMKKDRLDSVIKEDMHSVF